MSSLLSIKHIRNEHYKNNIEILVKIVFSTYAAANAFLVKKPVLCHRKKQTGFSLIEVMVAALILSTAILGVAGLQIVAMKGTQQSYMKQQAMGVVHNMIERMRANRSAVIAKDYLVDSDILDCTTALPNCSTADCTPQKIAEMDHLNLICGAQIGGGNFTNSVKVTNASDNAILTGGTLKVECAPVNLAEGILADCASGDVNIMVGWTERQLGDESPPVPDSLKIQTRIGL